MIEHIDIAMQTIEDDYKICLRIIGRYFDYLETCGLKEFNKYAKYRWSYDRDRVKGGSYVCIRYGNSLIKKCLVKKRAYIENEDLYNWVRNKELVQEALEEAYQYIASKVSGVKGEIDEMKQTAEEYAEKLENLSSDDDDDDGSEDKDSEVGDSDDKINKDRALWDKSHFDKPHVDKSHLDKSHVDKSPGDKSPERIARKKISWEK